jgi:hypothetical protein
MEAGVLKLVKPLLQFKTVDQGAVIPSCAGPFEAERLFGVPKRFAAG